MTIAAGFLATIGFTAVAFIAPLFGLPRTSFPELLGSVFAAGQMPRFGTAPWMLGLLWHFLNGSVIFALAYAFLVCPHVRVTPWLRGIGWGVVLWLVAMLVLLPLFGHGVFGVDAASVPRGILRGATDRPYLYWLTALVAHAAYGLVLGVGVGTRLGQAKHRDETTAADQAA